VGSDCGRRAISQRLGGEVPSPLAEEETGVVRRAGRPPSRPSSLFAEATVRPPEFPGREDQRSGAPDRDGPGAFCKSRHPVDHHPRRGCGDGLEFSGRDLSPAGAASFGPALGLLGGTLSRKQGKRWPKEKREDPEGQLLAALRAQSSGRGDVPPPSHLPGRPIPPPGRPARSETRDHRPLSAQNRSPLRRPRRCLFRLTQYPRPQTVLRPEARTQGTLCCADTCGVHSMNGQAMVILEGG
jgi:hypothetical protein